MDGEPYSATAWTGTIPADLIKKGLSIKVTYPGGERRVQLHCGCPTTDFGIVSLPFYFFGADPETTTHHDVTLTLSWPVRCRRAWRKSSSSDFPSPP